MFRGALVLTLRRLMPEALLIEVASHAALETALARSPPVKMVLLDLRMPGANGLSSLLFVRGEYSEVAVAIISGGAYAETIRRARQLGAAAFIPKSSPIETIGQALSCVIRGESWFPEDDEALAGRDARLHDQLTTLTPQQFRVLKYLVDGMLNKQIAEKLDVSEGTVRAHVTAILRKLNVSTRTQAAILVIHGARGFVTGGLWHAYPSGGGSSPDRSRCHTVERCGTRLWLQRRTELAPRFSPPAWGYAARLSPAIHTARLLICSKGDSFTPASSEFPADSTEVIRVDRTFRSHERLAPRDAAALARPRMTLAARNSRAPCRSRR